MATNNFFLKKATQGYGGLTCLLQSKQAVALLFLLITTAAQGQKKSREQLKEEINTTKADTTKARLQGELAWLIKFTEPQLATTLAEEELKIGYKYNDYLKLADAYRMLGLQYVVAQKYNQGLAYYDSCIVYAQKASNDYYQASCYSLRAGMYGGFSDFDQAIALYQKGLDCANKSKDPQIIAVLSNNLAETLKLSGKKSPEIAAMYQLALDNHIKTKQWKFATVTAANLAQEYMGNSNTTKAIELMQASKDFLQKDTSDAFLVAQTYNAYASIYLQLNNIDAAKENALISKQMLERYHLPDNLLLTVETLTKIYLAEKNYSKAEESALQQLSLAKQQSSKINISNAYKALAQIEEFKNDIPKSLSYYKLYKAWNDSVYNEKQQQNIANSESKALMAQKEFETKFFTNQKEKENASLKRQKWLAIASSALLLVLGLLLYNANRRKQKVNNQLITEKQVVEQQANEKLVLINEIHHRVKNNLTMLKSLLYLQGRAATEAETKRILTEAQSRIQSMALVHQNLYDGKNAAQLNLRNFIEELYNELSLSYFDKSKAIAIDVQGNCEDVDIETAIPLALIMNELATNSFKYAFNNTNEGKINTIISQQEKNISIAYFDNGPGLSNDFDITKGGFGFKVLNILTQQLNATIAYKKTTDKSIFEIVLPI